MAKGRKSGTSSASSATRKKQAAHAAKKADKRSRDLQALATLDEALAGGAVTDATGSGTPDAAPSDVLEHTLSPSFEPSNTSPSGRGQAQPDKPAPGDKTKAKQGKAAHMSKRQKREAKAKSKQYIPPAKVQGALDPLDTLGLAHQLPADLVVLLRKAGKKDLVTRQRALEGLKDYFEFGLSHLHDDSAPFDYESALVLMLPCWVHVFPRLSVSPTRRLRQLSAQIMGLLVSSDVTGPELLGTPEHTEAILGPWSLLAFDTDSAVTNAAFPAFEKHVYFSSPPDSSASVQLAGIQGREFVNHLRRAIVAPLDVFSAQVDAAPSGGSALLRDAKNRDEAVEESIEATCARIVAAALGSLAWAAVKDPAFGCAPAGPDALALDADVEALFTSDELWDCFHPPSASIEPSPARALAGASPQLRARAWSMLSALRTHHFPIVQCLLGFDKSPADSSAEGEGSVRMVQLLRDAWSERDASPFQLMLEAIIPLLRAFSDVWFLTTAGEESEDEDDEPDTHQHLTDSADQASVILDSPVWKLFVRWIRTACAGQPMRGAPTLVLFASTFPSCFWSPAAPAAQLLREALFSAFSYALSPVNVALDTASRKALIEGECEVIIFAARRILQATPVDDGKANTVKAKELVQSALGGLWADMLDSDAVSSTRAGPAAAARQRQNHAWLVQQSVKTLRSLAPKPGAAMTVDLLPSFLSSAIQSAVQAQQSGRATNVEAMVEIIALLAGPGPAGAPDTRGAAAAALSDVADLATNDLLQLDEDNSNDLGRVDERFELLTTLVSGLPASLASSPETAHLLHRLSGAAEVGIELTLLRQVDGNAPGASPTVAMSFIAALLPKLAATSEPPIDLPSFWMKLTGAIARLPALKAQVTALAPLLRLSPDVENKLLPSDDDQRAEMLAPLDHAVSELAEELFDPSVSHADTEATEVLMRLVRKPLPFVDQQVTQQVVVQAVTWAEYDLRDMISYANVSAGDHRLNLARQILAVGNPAEVAAAGEMTDLFPTAFVAAYCLDPARSLPEAVESARKLYGFCSGLSATVRSNVLQKAAGKLSSFVSDPKSTSLEVLQRAAAHLLKDNAASPVSLILAPILDELTILSSSLSALQPELALVDALIPSLLSKGAALPPPEEADSFDDLGLSAYARAALFSLRVSEGEEDVLQNQPELLIHWLYIGLLAEDALVSPRSAKHVFDPSSSDVVKAVFSHVVHDLSSAVAAAARGGAADHVLATVQGVVKGADPAPAEPLAHAAAQLASDALAGDANAIRSLQRLITGVVRFGSPSQTTLEQGLRWAHDLAVKGEDVGVAIARALFLELGEDKLVERLQTDTVVRLAGVKAGDASVQGMQLLSYILATSPGPEEAEPITSHRAIMVLKSLEKWYASDEELPDALAGQIAALGSRFLPIIQTVTGSHWDFLMDAAEMALEMAAEDPKDPANWPAAKAAITFFSGLLSFAAANQTLSETWNTRKDGVYGLVVSFVLSLAPGESEPAAALPPAASPAEEVLWDVLLPLATAIPEKAFATAVEEAARGDSLDRDLVSMLLAGPTPSVQLFSFRRLSAITKKRTEDEVVRLALEAEVAAAAQESIQRETVHEELEDKPETREAEAPDTSSEASFSSATADPSASKLRDSADAREKNSNNSQVQTDDDDDALSVGAVPKLEQVPSPATTDNAPNFVAGLVDALSSRSMPLVNESDEPSAFHDDRRHIWGTLLGWLLLFDHFDGASLPLATSLLDRLRRARSVESALLPLTFDTLLPELQAKELDLDLWGIDEVYLNLLDVTDSSALSVLAAHVYLRALATVPALVRSWWMGLRDRSLISAVERFTVRYCTPVLARWEMGEVQAATSTPATGGALGISGLGVRAAGTHEAVASYTVDEETLEVRVRLPRNFPLTPVSIGDGGRNPPAVPVAKWRAWMLATQQLVANRNAPLLDAVALFGRNAEARFAGFEGQECAICYSILSPADHSLPTKPCKTCHNKFHGQCLYKWVTTSGNSTCPLCRSML